MRLFIAIPVPPQVKEQLIERQTIDGIKWQRADQIHLTLKFLGDTDPDLVDNLKNNLGKIPFPEFSLSITGFGYFPKGKQPRILWAGVANNKLLDKLHQEIEETCSEMGFEPESRKFKPHITVGRVKHASRDTVDQFINRHQQLHISDIPITEFVLYESNLGPEGAEHLRLKTFQLKPN